MKDKCTAVSRVVSPFQHWLVPSLFDDEDKTRISYAGKTFEITSSFGVAVFPKHGRTIEEVISVADRALYQSKQNGRNRVTLL